MDPESDKLPRWECHKIVRAAKIERVEDFRDPADESKYLPHKHLHLDGGVVIIIGWEWFAKHEPRAGGYYVVYEDGYASYSPAHAFESGYTRIAD